MKLFMVYYYDTDMSEDAEFFVADEKQDIEEQFIAYRKRCGGARGLSRDDISDCFQLRTAMDKDENVYLVGIRPKERKKTI